MGVLNPDRVIQTAIVDIGALTGSASADITVTWPAGFADTNYTVVAVCRENVSTATNGALVRQVRTKSTGSCVVRVSTGTQGFSAGQCFIEAMGFA